MNVSDDGNKVIESKELYGIILDCSVLAVCQLLLWKWLLLEKNLQLLNLPLV